jgi:hypothetical protein
MVNLVSPALQRGVRSQPASPGERRVLQNPGSARSLSPEMLQDEMLPSVESALLQALLEVRFGPEHDCGSRRRACDIHSGLRHCHTIARAHR